jgi:uncharacterized repeat protein (TIGR01451 family)
VTDSPTTNNSATDTDTITLSADLSITKNDGKSSVVAGTQTTYTITVTNNGPSDVTGATVSDTFPSSFTGVTWTCSADAGSSCAAASGSGNISTTVSLQAGDSATFTATGTVASSATGTLSNTASVTAPGGVTDPAGNNSATDTDTITLSADLSITKNDGKSSVVAGTSNTYTIIVTNNGPSDVTGAAVADSMPSELTAVSWTCSASAGSSCAAASGSGNISTTVSLQAGDSATFTVSATVKSSATGSVANTATVTAPAGVTDSPTTNNSATDTDTITLSADLKATKTGSDSVYYLNPISYTVVITNLGPSDVVGATVTDNFPTGLTNISWTC